jgi:hypothetical protein
VTRNSEVELTMIKRIWGYSKSIISKSSDSLKVFLHRRKGKKLYKSLTAAGSKPENRTYNKAIQCYWEEHYGKKVNPIWHHVITKLTGVEDVRFIPNDVWFLRILPYYNDLALRPAYSDKNLCNKLFFYPRVPKLVIKRVHGRYYDSDNKLLHPDLAKDTVISQANNMIIKTSKTDNGRNVRLLQAENKELFLNGEMTDYSLIEKLYGNNYLIQHQVEQSSVLGVFHPQSLNKYD